MTKQARGDRAIASLTGRQDQSKRQTIGVDKRVNPLSSARRGSGPYSDPGGFFELAVCVCTGTEVLSIICGLPL
jgi:hypothetical protein